jgi:hypothetical protein
MLFVALGLAWFVVARHASRVAPPPSPAVTMPAAAAVPAAPIGPTSEVDLGPYVTHRLNDSMLQQDGNNLAHLLTGLTEEGPAHRTFNGVPFRLDGIILVGPGETSSDAVDQVTVRPEVDGIRIGRKAARLHFLHGTHWQAQEGETIASYAINYANGSRVVVPVRYGLDVVDWWEKADPGDETARSHLAWVGTNDAANSPIRLFMKSWTNPSPEVPIRTLDMVTGTQAPGHGAAAPFLVGLTVEESTPSRARSLGPEEP